MEQSTDCPRPSPVRGPHGGWKQQEIDALRESIAAAEERGESLRSVFERMSGQLGRRPVRGRMGKAHGQHRLKPLHRTRWKSWWSRSSPPARRA